MLNHCSCRVWIYGQFLWEDGGSNQTKMAESESPQACRQPVFTGGFHESRPQYLECFHPGAQPQAITPPIIPGNVFETEMFVGAL